MRNKNILFLTMLLAPMIFLGAGCATTQQQPTANTQAPAQPNTAPSATGNQAPPAAVLPTPVVSQPPAASPTPVASKQLVEVTVSISNFAFVPQQITVAPGTTVVWKNSDNVPHHILSQGNFESADLQQGDEYKFTFSTAGTFSYICKIHPSMQGTIIVKP